VGSPIRLSVSSKVEIPGYELEATLHSSTCSDVYVAVRRSDQRRVVLKRYTPQGSTGTSVRDEWEALTRLSGPGVPRALELLYDSPRPVLVMEHVPGISLSQWIAEREPSIAHVLSISLQLSSVIERVHAARLLHQDLHPDNILVTPECVTAHVLDFGHCRRMGEARTAPASSTVIGGSLYFIAPEQTGRMNRGCDPRSDLYSFGAVLYFVLTGRPPFTGRDKLELIHAHIAKRPRAPKELAPRIPLALSELVLRLLAKEPDDRYPTAASLTHDLALLEDEWKRAGTIEDQFDLGGPERHHGPRLPRKTWGREPEREALHGAYACAREGTTQVVVLEGDVGAGKSGLVADLRPRVAQTGGHLASACFDPQRDRPYSGWAGILQSIAEQLLLEPEAELEFWRARLVETVGSIASVLIDLAPDLRFVLPEVPDAPALGPLETRARLTLAIRRSLRALACAEHPLVVCLDDVHWSDGATRHVLTQLIQDACDTPGLLLIATFESSARSERPVRELLEALQQSAAPVHRITLGPLAREHVSAMLAEVLRAAPSQVDELAEWVERKTQNTPLLIQECLTHLYAQGVLRAEREGGWSWDIDAIAAAPVTSDAAAVLTAKLGAIGAEHFQIVRVAACCGDPFDASLIAELGEIDPEQVSEALYALVELGLVIPHSGGFRFSHDEIREAARRLMPEAEQQRRHARMASLLLEGDEDWRGRVFEIADHLTRGHAELTPELRSLAIEIHREAAERALQTAAVDSARSSLVCARGLHCERDWDQDPAGSISLFLLCAEAASQAHDFDRALAELDQIDARNPRGMDRIRVVTKRIEVLTLRGDVDLALRHALKELRRLGVRWPDAPSALRARLAIARTRFAMRGRDLGDLLRPSALPGPTRLATLILLRQSAGLIGRAGGELGILSACYCLRDAIRNGYVNPPGFLIACYAVNEYPFLRNREYARDLASFALRAQDMPCLANDPLGEPRTALVVHSVLRPFLVPRREALRELPRVARELEEVGDVEWTYYARYLHRVYLALAGERVDASERALMELARSSAASTVARAPIAAAASALTLLLREDLESALCEARSHASLFGVGGDPSPPGVTLWMQSLLISNQVRAVMELSAPLASSIERLTPGVHVLDFALYRGLAAASSTDDRSGWSRRGFRRELRHWLRVLEKWRSQGPDVEHMVLLLRAERARLRRNPRGAEKLYVQASERALQQGFVQHAAIARELLARMLRSRGRGGDAYAAALQAAEHYEAWGARPKARALRRR